MTQTPMDLIRKLDETAAALLQLAAQVRHAAPEVADPELRREMLESADGMEQRAQEMAAVIQQWRREIN